MVLKFDDPLEACRAVVAESYRLWLQYEVRTDDITMIMAFLDWDEAGPDPGAAAADPRRRLSRCLRLARRLLLCARAARSDAACRSCPGAKAGGAQPITSASASTSSAVGGARTGRCGADCLRRSAKR